MADTVYKFRRPGQCCGNCRHMAATGNPGRWHDHVCRAIIAKDGTPGTMPVVPEAGTHCPYWRRASEGTP